MPQVSVVGTGVVGSALARCLLENGFDVTVWNRSADKTVSDLCTGGATEAVTPVAELELRGGPDHMLGTINAYPSDIGRDATAILAVSSPDAWHSYGGVVRKSGGPRAGSAVGRVLWPPCSRRCSQPGRDPCLA